MKRQVLHHSATAAGHVENHFCPLHSPDASGRG
jgi:hypothetical protein